MIELAVTSILETNDKFTIFSAKTADGNLIRVVADNSWCDLFVGETYKVEGNIEIYQNFYGWRVPQLTASCMERTQTSGKLILPWLKNLPGIGKTRSQRLWEAFGSGIITILKDWGSLDEVAEVLEPKRINLGHELAMQLNRAIYKKADDDRFGIAGNKFRLNLENIGITDTRAVKCIWRMIGSDKAEKEFFLNPFMSATLIPWKSADSIGQTIIRIRDKADPADSDERLVAAMDSCWRYFLQKGHTAASEKQLMNALTDRLKTYPRVLRALHIGKRCGAAVAGVNGLLRAPGAAFMEDEIAERLKNMADNQTDNYDKDALIRIVCNIEKKIGIHLFNEQRNAVVHLLKRDFCILQGEAGTGKTYMVKVLVQTWEALRGQDGLGESVVLACLSGKASMQLSRSTNRPAYTLAGLLFYLRNRKQRNLEGRKVPKHWPYLGPSTLLIVDEASMVGVGIWHELLEFMPSGCRLIMVGDNGQLPPVGIGQIYHDLIRCYSNVLELNLNHRQKNKSGISEIASKIRRGQVPEFNQYSGAEQGVQFVECHQENVLQTVSRIKNEILSQVTEGDVRICAALRNTVDSINEAGAQLNHNNKESIRVASGVWIANGDPVVYTQNRYKQGLFNGLLGRVVKVFDADWKKAIIHWDGEDNPREIFGNELSGIELAYAITTHKMQGSSAARIIIPLERSTLVTRQWLYTAVTRAEEQCVFVGERSFLSMCLKRQTERVTGFRIGVKS